MSAVSPVITASEVDTTIADLVADKRASTPTKAGVVAVPDILDTAVGRHQGKRTRRRRSGEIRRDIVTAYPETNLVR